MTTSGLPVLAGLDDSSDSMTAVETAAAEAKRRHVPLWLVMPGSTPSTSSWRPVADPVDLFGRVMTRLSDRYPELEVIAEVHPGDLDDFIARASHQTSIVIAGPHTPVGRTG